MTNPSASPKSGTAVGAANGTSSGMTAILSRHWGPERSVQILRDPTKSLGISIVGGKVGQLSVLFHLVTVLPRPGGFLSLKPPNRHLNSARPVRVNWKGFSRKDFCFVLFRLFRFYPQVDVASGSGAPITGIFIKNVLPDSPAGRTGQLRVRKHYSLVIFKSIFPTFFFVGVD